MYSRISLSILAILVLLSGQTSSARLLNIPQDFQTIQAGIDAAQSGDSIVIAQGTYHESLQIQDKSITIMSSNGNSRAIVDPRHEGFGMFFQRCGSADSVVLLQDLIIRNGGRAPENDGGGIIAYDSYLTLNRVDIDSCWMPPLGWNLDEGGGLKAFNSHLSLVKVTIRECIAESGGAIMILNSYLEAENLIVENCRSLELGAVELIESNVRITTSRLNGIPDRREDAEHVCRMGACIYLFRCAAVLDSAIIEGGTAESGGGLHAYQSVVEITRSIITGNNSVLMGGGLMFWETRYNIDHSVIYGNSAGDMGGGIFSADSSNSLIANSIIYSNRAPESPQYRSDCWRGWNVAVTVEYCDIEGGRNPADIEDTLNWGAGNITADPRFVNGRTRDFRLTARSPCLDAGNPGAPFDLDGTRSDIGSFSLHQRDIVVEPRDVHFAPIWWREVDSLSVTISNVGETPLTIFNIRNDTSESCIWSNGLSGGENVVILPGANQLLWVFFRPDSAMEAARSISIASNDPTDSTITVRATGDFPTGVRLLNLQSPIFNLQSPFPNPFNSSTTISYTLPEAGWNEVDVVDVNGRLVSALVRERVSAGEHSVTWNAAGVPAGVYLVRVKAGDANVVRKVVLVR